MARLTDEEIISQVKNVSRGMFVGTGNFKRIVVGKSRSPQIHVEIACSVCKVTKYVLKYHYLRGSYVKCQCSHLRIPEVGTVFGRWTVVGGMIRNKQQYARVECDCGSQSAVRLADLLYGHSKMCVACGHESRKMTVGQLRYRAYERLFNSYRRNAKKAGREFSLSIEKFISLVTSECEYSGHPPMGIAKPHQLSDIYIMYNGIDRVDNEQGYTVRNSVTCCYVCNRAKQSMPYEEWDRWLKGFRRKE